MERLLAAGADPMAADAGGVDLLMAAMGSHSIVCLDLLIESLRDKGVTYSPTQADARGRTLLHYAIGNYEDIVVGARVAMTTGVVDSHIRVQPTKFLAGFENDCTERLRDLGSTSVASNPHGEAGISVTFADVALAYSMCGFSSVASWLSC